MMETGDQSLIVVTSGTGGGAAAVATLGLREAGYRVELTSDAKAGSGDCLLVVESGAACAERALEHVVALRSKGYGAPILVLCGDSSPVSACRCLEAGADDYVRAPCEPAELAARIRRLRFRSPTESRAMTPFVAATSWIAAPESLLLNENEQSARIGAHEAFFQDLPFQMFTYLTSCADKWCRRTELVENVLRRRTASEAAVRWNVHRVRDALGPYHGLIHGDGKLGYMFSFQHCKRRHCERGLRARERLSARES